MVREFYLSRAGLFFFFIYFVLFFKVQIERWVLKQEAGLWGVVQRFWKLIVVATGVYHFLNLIEMYVNSSSRKLIFESVQNLDK